MAAALPSLSDATLLLVPHMAEKKPFPPSAHFPTTNTHTGLRDPCTCADLAMGLPGLRGLVLLRQEPRGPAPAQPGWTTAAPEAPPAAAADQCCWLHLQPPWMRLPLAASLQLCAGPSPRPSPSGATSPPWPGPALNSIQMTVDVPMSARRSEFSMMPCLRS